MKDDQEFEYENEPERDEEGFLDQGDPSDEDVNPDEDLPFGTAGVTASSLI